MKSTKLLMADHEIILQALHILEAVNKEIQRGRQVDHDIRSLLTFLRDFADGCHHVKEEAIFFPALIQAGMRLDGGPLDVMNYEHQRGRALSASMQDALDRGKMDDFLACSGRYIELLSEHIEKENLILFDKADQILSDEDDEKVAEDFEHYETLLVGAQAHQRLHRIIETLSSKYLVAALRRY